MAGAYGGNWTYINPFGPLDESVLTSNIVSTRFAWDVTASFYTISGTTNEHVWWVSNASGNPHHSVHGTGTTPSLAGIPEASWSQWTSFGHIDAAVSGASFIDPPLGFRWARITREASGASITVQVNRLER
jgi:hypothetical protein